MICWGLGAFGLGLTGLLETNTKEDMGEHSAMVLLWAANLASQPNTARHLLAAKRRGAHVVTIDVRRTEAAAKSDQVLLIRPGTDGALALALMHVICAEGLHDAAFVARHTLGFEALEAHLRAYTPGWAEAITGIDAADIVALARRYAGTRPAMIVLGGSSMHKSANGWEAARAIACLPGLTGNVGLPGSGFGPRHGAGAHGRGLGGSGFGHDGAFCLGGARAGPVSPGHVSKGKSGGGNHGGPVLGGDAAPLAPLAHRLRAHAQPPRDRTAHACLGREGAFRDQRRSCSCINAYPPRPANAAATKNRKAVPLA
jgi:hypothetical protein